jgi:hypothetical protein
VVSVCIMSRLKDDASRWRGCLPLSPLDHQTMTTRHCVSDVANNEGQETVVRMELKKTQNPRRMMQEERKGVSAGLVCCVESGRAGCSCNGRAPRRLPWKQSPVFNNISQPCRVSRLRAPPSLLGICYIDLRMELSVWGVCVS